MRIVDAEVYCAHFFYDHQQYGVWDRKTRSAAERLVRCQWIPYNPWVVPETRPSVAKGVEPIEVVLTASEWGAVCPACRNAMYASSEDHRFFCIRCGNQAVGNLWVPTKWPKSRAKIEELVLLRPDPSTRNWFPGESLADLRAENLEHGIESDAA